MRIVPCGVDSARLALEVAAIPLVRMQDGSGSSHMGGPEGWIHGLSMSRVGLRGHPVIDRAILALRQYESRYHEGLGKIVQVMVNKLEPGALLDRHRDGEPDNARYHLPVWTHPDVYWWDEYNGHFHMEEGKWYGPMPYCGVLHSVGNPSPVERVHVIVDFERVPHATHV
jgi:hypothetical protein